MSVTTAEMNLLDSSSTASIRIAPRQNTPRTSAVVGSVFWPSMSGLLYCLGFFAYTTILICFVYFGLETRGFSFVYKVSFLGFASACFIGQMRRGNLVFTWPWLPLALFWGLYIIRILYDGYWSTTPLRLTPIEYLQYCLGLCFVPALAFSCRMQPRESRFALGGFILSAVAATCVSLYFYRELFGTNFSRLGSGEAATVNPLTVAYPGASLVLLGLYLLIDTEALKKTARWLAFCLIALGFFPLALGASRGALLSIGFGLAVIALARGKSRFKTVLCVIATAVVAVPFALKYATELGSNVLQRVELTSSELKEGQTGLGRVRLWIDAFDQFVQSPLTGSGLEEENSGFYPHNMILESFMATGVLGGCCFTLASLAGIWKAYKLLAKISPHAWLSVLYLQFFIEGQVSGALYLSGFYWYLLAAVLAADAGSGRAGPNSRRSRSARAL
jgi:O-antigen ligase